MKKSLLIVLFVLAVVGVGGYWFYYGRGGEEGADGGAPEEKGFIGKIADALKVGTAMKCTWSEEDTSTIFHIKGGKLRGSVTTNGDEVEYILRENCMYYWGEEEGEGVKWCWPEAEAPNWEEQLQASAANAMYNCQPATVSDSMFNPPSGINFMDMSEYLTP